MYEIPEYLLNQSAYDDPILPMIKDEGDMINIYQTHFSQYDQQEFEQEIEPEPWAEGCDDVGWLQRNLGW